MTESMADEESLAGRTVVVTGSGRGLGFDMARRFGLAGASVVIAEIDSQAGEAAAEQLRAQNMDAAFRQLDVALPEESARLVETIVEERGAIDVWVNNAGVARKGPAETLPIHDWDASISVMLSGAYYCCRAAGAAMLAKGRGVIVNVASVNGYQAVEGRVAYCTAKAGLIMLTQSLGVEWASRGVRVVGIAPGVVLTDMVKRGIEEGTANVETYHRRTPMRRLGSEQEISEAVFYLASDEASSIVAETMRVDGGWGAYSYF